MKTLRQHVLPWLKVLLSQALALAAAMAISGALGIYGPALLIVQGLIAAAGGRLLSLSRLWIPIQLLLPIAVAYNAVVPSWIYPLALVFCALIYWNSASEQVPLYLTNRRTWDALSALAMTEKATSFVDLGSGLGGVVIHLAANPALHAKGLETAPLVYLASKIRIMLSGRSNAQVIYRSIWDEDLSAHDIVYCFLSPVPMPRMFEKARAEMRAGTLLVSNSFAVQGVDATTVIAVDDGRKTQLHVYRM